MCPKLLFNTTLNNTYHGNTKAYETSDIVWGLVYDYGVMYTEIHVSWSIKMKVMGDNIATMYNMVPYKLKAMHVKDDILNFPPIRNNKKCLY